MANAQHRGRNVGAKRRNGGPSRAAAEPGADCYALLCRPRPTPTKLLKSLQNDSAHLKPTD